MANRDQQKTLVNDAKQAFLQEQKTANPLVAITDQQQKKKLIYCKQNLTNTVKNWVIYTVFTISLVVTLWPE